MVAVQPPPLRVPIVDSKTGLPTLVFRDYLERALKRAGGPGNKTILVIAGSGASTDNAVVRFDGTTGGVFQNSGVTIDDSDNLSLSGTVDGRDVATDGTKLDGVETAATADQTDAEVKTAYEANADTNAFDDAEQTKLAGIETGAEVNEITGFGAVQVFETVVGQAALASAGTVTLLDSSGSQTWKVRHVLFSGDGTNFSGGGGDRDLSVSDGTATWTVIPAATLQALAAARWGDTGAPFPATAAHLTQSSVAGTDITAQYSGGTTDYTAGQATIVIIAERTA